MAKNGMKTHPNILQMVKKKKERGCLKKEGDVILSLSKYFKLPIINIGFDKLNLTN